MSVQPAWNLDTTSTSTLQVAKGLLHAATTDDVQPLCIMACEQFGNTLAISPQTLRKIEHSVLPSPQSPVISFIKSTIGYSKNDCVSYLGKSQAGLQFLALASAFATWPNKFDAAQCLHSMLISTASDKALMPTVRQVKSLLTSTESRCHHSGFMVDVIGWHLLLKRHPALSNYNFPDEPCIPDGEGMANMVDTFRQLNRIGAADITRVIIRTCISAPWTIAFAAWSLGHPPTIIVGKTGLSVIESPESRVTISISDQDDQHFSITTYSSIHGPSDLVSPASEEPAFGMINLHNYGQVLLDEFHIDSDIQEKALQAAMPHAICKIIHLFCHKVAPESLPPDYEPVTQQTVSPFRSLGVIRTIYRLLFKEELCFDSIKVVTDISSLPDVALAVGSCSCGLCNRDEFWVHDRPCKWSRFLTSLAVIVIDVLALSLYDCPDRLKIKSQDASDLKFDPFVREILMALINKNFARPHAGRFLHRALRITGHETYDLQGQLWAVSSVMGQATWLTLYESHSYCRGGYLSLSWHPGILQHNGERFNLAKFLTFDYSRRFLEEPFPVPSTLIRTPCNLFPNLELDWHVSKGEDRLYVDLGVRVDTKTHASVSARPMGIIEAFEKVIIPRNCPHPPDTDLPTTHPGVKITGPCELWTIGIEHQVVPVAGDDSLRFLALCGVFPDKSHKIILHDKACLNCSLRVCQEYSRFTLIL